VSVATKATQEAAVEARPSKYSSQVSATGVGVTEAEAVLGAYRRLFEDRLAEARNHPISRQKTLTLKKVCLFEDGSYQLLDCDRPVSFIPDCEGVKVRSQFRKRGHGGAYLDEVMEGEAWSQPNDQGVYELFLEMAEAEQPTGYVVTELNRLMQAVILVRNGYGRPEALDLPV
jgi:hypothetical protein